MTAEPKKFRLLLDTHPLIKMFAKEENWEVIQNIVLQIENEEIEAAISVVTLTEIYYKYMHEKRADLAKTRVESLKYATYLKKLSIDERIAIKAGEFKGKYSIPIADSLIAATAFYDNSIILSDDEDFKKVTEIKVQNEKEIFQKM